MLLGFLCWYSAEEKKCKRRKTRTWSGGVCYAVGTRNVTPSQGTHIHDFDSFISFIFYPHLLWLNKTHASKLVGFPYDWSRWLKARESTIKCAFLMPFKLIHREYSCGLKMIVYLENLLLGSHGFQLWMLGYIIGFCSEIQFSECSPLNCWKLFTVWIPFLSKNRFLLCQFNLTLFESPSTYSWGHRRLTRDCRASGHPMLLQSVKIHG